jgi:hypothetical protein
VRDEGNLWDASIQSDGTEGIGVETIFSDSPCHHTPPDSPFVQKLLRFMRIYGTGRGLLAVGGPSNTSMKIEGGVAFGCACRHQLRIHGGTIIGINE